jgi:hypothetical protein
MTRICYILFIGFVLFTACKRSKKDNPCDGIMCDSPMRLGCPFKLVDAVTGRDLVYGPDARIPLDSIKIQMPDTALPVKQLVDSSKSRSILYFYIGGPQSLRIGRPGKFTLDKLTFLTKVSGCCGSSIVGLQLNDNPVPIKPDSSGIFLIPYTL